MTNSQLTVVQLCPRLNSGGIERGTVDLAIALKEAGFNSIVISGGGFLEQELKNHQLTHICLPIYSKNPLIFIMNLFRLAKVLRELKPDIVHPRSRIPTWLVFILRKKLKGHVVTSCNGIHSLDKWGFKKLYNGVLVKGEAIIANSEFTKKYLVRNYAAPSEKISVIYRGIDIERFNDSSENQEKAKIIAKKWNIDNDKIKIILPARLAYWKGQHIFIEACHILQKTADLNFVALLVGDNHNASYLHELNKLIGAYGLQNQVKILGEVQDMQAVYAVADLVISSSIEPEAFGRSIVEAQAMAKPVIASNHGGAAETIIGEQTGWLYQPTDSKALAQLILHVIQLPEQEKLRVIAGAKQRVQAVFSKKHMCDGYINLYRSLL